MKFNFESKLKHQINAINSVINLFVDIKTKKGIFSSQQVNNLFSSYIENIGYSNQIITSDWLEIVNKNMHEIQENNCLEKTKISENSPTFDIEMETGTGKTYVFLRTILELSKNYNFNKFIIIVPSIAIKEGVLKTYKITQEHFKNIYGNITYRMFDYDSSQINELQNFYNSDDVEIMLMTVQSINKTSNKINVEIDLLNGESGIDLISKTNPIVIIDEPQTTSSTEKSVESINKLNPLFKLRYSATFRKRKNEHLIYKLDAIAAHNQNLVKEIIVNGCKIENIIDRNIYLKSIKNEKIYLETWQNGKKKQAIVKINDNIGIAFNDEKLYEIKVEEIIDDNSIILSNGKELHISNLSNSLFNKKIREWQIETTIKHHLDKQIELKDHNIKVLSLFFIDEVKKYRYYDENGNIVKGEYAIIFEKMLKKILLENPKYKKIFNYEKIDEEIEKIHDGYFSIDNKKQIKDTNGNTKIDNQTYIKIMRDKELLLSFKEKLSFIFSHTALREGWDNPNVFQICTLNTTSSEIKKRQEIGRGLRLCVNQSGERIYDKNINKLIIIANDSYENFASDLQKEFIEDGISFDKMTKEYYFECLKDKIQIEEYKKEIIYDKLISYGFIHNNKVTESIYDNQKINEMAYDLKEDLSRKDIDDVIGIIENYLPKVVKNYESMKKIIFNKEILKNKKFSNFWNIISKKTYFNININIDELIKKSIVEINKEVNFNTKINIKSEKIKINIKQNEISSEIISKNTIHVDNYNFENEFSIYEMVCDVANKTKLKRNTIFNIINNSKIMQLIRIDPIECEKIVCKSIFSVLNELSQTNIKYYLINDHYQMSQFDDEMLNFDNDHLIEVKNKNKTIYNYIKCDSNIEEKFLNDIDIEESVINFIKFPKWYKIPTPIGNYTPDWAIYYVNENKIVVETKGNSNLMALREEERLKIFYGKKHFQAIDNNIKFEVATSFDELTRRI